MIRACVRSACVAANRALIGAPSEIPNSAARSAPAPSRTAVRSSIRCSSVWGPSIGSDSPVPGLSKEITRANLVSRRTARSIAGSSNPASRCETNPGTRTRSIGPSPASE